MIIRKYLVDDINEALFRIKHELGDEAYIISQKQVRQPGVKGFFTNKKLEVTVGLVSQQDQQKVLKEPEEVHMAVTPNKEAVTSQMVNQVNGKDQGQSISYYNKLFEEKQKVLNNFGEEIFTPKEPDVINKMNTSYPNTFITTGNRGVDAYKASEESKSRIMDLNSQEPSYENIAFNNKVASEARGEGRIDHLVNTNVNQGLTRDMKSSEEILSDLKKDISEIKGIMEDFINRKPKGDTYLDEILTKQDICKELRDDIKNSCPLSYEERMNKSSVKSYLRDVFSKIIKVYEGTVSNKVVVVGPTGSGKTTTVAKLAGMLSLNLNKKVGLVTIDTFRVGAVEQLKIYGEIMNIPYKYVTTLNDIRTVFDDMKSCDVILVDTIGRSNKNIIHLNELNMFVQSIQSDEVTLVISAGMKDQDLEGFVNSFKGIKFKNVIITKLDETSSFGTFVNVCYKTSLPISFITVGQDVPLDIKKADKEEILDMILGE